MSRAERAAHARRNWGTDDDGATILHVDMDAFFAEVELLDYPELRGTQVIVGGQQRGVVLSATYQARALGVHSAMPMRTARALAPRAVILEPHHEKYKDMSARVMALLREVTPVLEAVSIDEAFLDVAGARRRLGTPTQIAAQIRARIWSELGVPASVGIAGTKFVAKLASGHAKPDGMLLIPIAATTDFLHSLPVGAMWGVGAATEKRLANVGIRTVAELAACTPARLESMLGVAAGRKLHDLSWGRDPRPVEVTRHEKSVSHEQTFVENISDREALAAVLLDQAHRCAARLRAASVLAATIGIKVRSADFTTLSRSITLDNPTDVAHTIYAAAKTLLGGLPIPPGGVRLIGVKCESLSDAATTVIQPTFDDPGPDRRHAEQAMDSIRAKFGDGSVNVGSLVADPATRNRSFGLS